MSRPRTTGFTALALADIAEAMTLTPKKPILPILIRYRRSIEADERRRFVEEELPGLLAKALEDESQGVLLPPGRLTVEWPTTETYERRAAVLAAAIRELL